jgi:hypothetical protein
MRATVDLLRAHESELGYMPPIVLGGGTVDEQVCRYAGADSWSSDAMEGVRSAAVTSVIAVDERGTRLAPAAQHFRQNARFGLQSHHGSDSRIRLKVELGPTARDVSLLKRVEGTVDLYKPTEQNGGLAIIRVTPNPDTRLESPALEKQGVVMTIADDATTTPKPPPRDSSPVLRARA